MGSEQPPQCMTKDDLPTSVADWMGKQGYPLEMRVAAAFLKAGLRIIQADYYEDPDTKTPREIDVLALADAAIDAAARLGQIELLRLAFTVVRVTKVPIKAGAVFPQLTKKTLARIGVVVPTSISPFCSRGDT